MAQASVIFEVIPGCRLIWELLFPSPGPSPHRPVYAVSLLPGSLSPPSPPPTSSGLPAGISNITGLGKLFKDLKVGRVVLFQTQCPFPPLVVNLSTLRCLLCHVYCVPRSTLQTSMGDSKSKTQRLVFVTKEQAKPILALF